MVDQGIGNLWSDSWSQLESYLTYNVTEKSKDMLKTMLCMTDIQSDFV